MDVAQALRIAAERNGLSPAAIAAAADVTEAAARRWMKGESEPRLAQYQLLRKNVPGFADLVDGNVAA